MLNEIDWSPFILATQIVAGFVLVCLAAGASDTWAKGCRKRRIRQEPVAFHKGERIYLN